MNLKNFTFKNEAGLMIVFGSIPLIIAALVFMVMMIFSKV